MPYVNPAAFVIDKTVRDRLLRLKEESELSWNDFFNSLCDFIDDNRHLLTEEK